MQNDRLAWPILLLLLTVLVPSLGVVWMMREAVRNEQLATSQRLREAYQTQLKSASLSVQDRWSTQLDLFTRMKRTTILIYTKENTVLKRDWSLML